MSLQRGVVGASVVLGFLVLRVAGQADEAAAVKAVEVLGGKVTVDGKQSGKPVVGVNVRATDFTDAGLKKLKEFKRLQTLDLSQTKVTDAGLKELKEFKRL